MLGGQRHGQVSLKAKTLLDSTTALHWRFIISEKGFLGAGGFLVPNRTPISSSKDSLQKQRKLIGRFFYSPPLILILRKATFSSACLNYHATPWPSPFPLPEIFPSLAYLARSSQLQPLKSFFFPPAWTHDHLSL